MAPVIQSYESQEVLNVSQDARTSPTSVVEDSLVVTKRGGPVQSTNQDQNEGDPCDDDELYTVSPQIRAANNAARSATKEVEHTAPKVVSGSALSKKPIAKVSREEVPIAGSRSALNETSNNGNRAHSGKDVIHRPTDHVANVETEDTTQDNRRKSSGGSISMSAISTASSKAKVTSQVSAPTSVTTKAKATPASNMSALAALRARKDGSSNGATASTAPESASRDASTKAKAQPAESMRKVLSKKDKNARTSAPEPATGRNHDHQPDEKPKSRKLGMLAVTPARILEKTMMPMPMDETENHAEKAGPSTVLEKKGKSQQTATNNSKAASTASRITRPRTKVTAPSLGSFYEIPASPPREQATKSKGKSQSKEKQAGAQQKTGNDGGSHVAGKKARGRPKKRPVVEDSDDYVDAPARTQPARTLQASAPSKARKAAPRKTAAPSSSNENEFAVDNQHESIKDFEQAVTHMDEDGSVAEQIAIERRGNGTVEGSADELAQPDLSQAKTKVKDTDAKCGASQDNAIMLSDRQEPSSELDGPEPVAATRNLKTRPATRPKKAPQTPAAPPPSPPDYAGDKTHEPAPDLGASRRSIIIGFDRSGPRIQGTRSIKKPPGTPWRDRTSVGPASVKPIMQRHSALAHLEVRRRRLGPSSTAGSMRSQRTHRTDRTAQPENVAADVADALSGLLGRDKKPAMEYEPELRTKAEIAAWGEHNEEESFQLVDDALPLPATSIAKEEPLAREKMSTQPQLPRTASQVAMPPPAPKMSKFADGDVPAAVPVLKSLAVANRVSTRAHAAAKSLKRTSAADDTEAPMPKKQKSKQAAQSSMPDTIDIIPAKPKPVKRVTQAASRSKVSRKASQGNVDVGGSPIPKDMVVPVHATALEIFSQQAGLSSDSGPVHAKPAPSMSTTSAMRVGDPTFFDHLLSVPSYQPQQLASNDKRKPASPGEESAAITSIGMHQLNDRRLVIQDGSGSPPTDPFNSAEEAREHTRKESSSSQLAKKLRQHTAPYFRKRKGEAFEVEDPEKTLLEEELQPKKRKTAQAATIAHANIAVPAEEDPDMTLVEHEPPPKKRKVAGVSKVVQAEVAVPAEEDEDMSDIAFWRNGLRNYQVNMFDELVGISHKLMRHLIDRETAMREAVSDYRHEGLNMIEEMEQRHAREYQASLEKLEERKEKMRGDLTAVSERLQGAVAGMAQKKSERSETARKLDEEETRLTEILAGMR